MKPETLRGIALLMTWISAAAVWCGVIVVALQVSTIVLDTLHQIVELAQMS